MAKAYTKRLDIAQGSTGSHFSEPVPAGKRWVIRCIDIRVHAGAGASLYYGVGGVATWWVLLSGTLASNPWHQWQGRQVLEAGEQIWVSFPQGQVDVVTTGYELDV